MKCLATALLTVGLTSAALADEVFLTNGRSLVGIVHQEPNRVLIETRLGDIGIPHSDVKEVVPGKTPIHDYHERLDALGQKPSAADVFALAMWAQDQGLVRYVNGLLQRTIELEPNHAEARKLLDYVRYEGRWIRSRERSAVMEVQDRREAARKKPATVPIRRTTAQVERTPYWLGMPPYPPPRGSTRYDTGYIPYFPRAFYGSGSTGTATPTTGPTMSSGGAAGGFPY
jgi:hypothetical protein